MFLKTLFIIKFLACSKNHKKKNHRSTCEKNDKHFLQETLTQPSVLVRLHQAFILAPNLWFVLLLSAKARQQPVNLLANQLHSICKTVILTEYHNSKLKNGYSRSSIFQLLGVFMELDYMYFDLFYNAKNMEN